MKKSKLPKISVCIPVHNAELWIAEAIQSIERQSFTDWEIVAVDDASTDSSLQVLKFYEKKLGPEKFKLITLKTESGETCGIAYTRNIAVATARGEIICVQDADDISHKERLVKTWKFFQRHKKVSLIYGHCQYIDALGRPFHMKHAEDFDLDVLIEENYIQHPTVAYRRKDVLEVPYRADCKVLDDWFLYYDFAKAGKILSPLPEVLAFYRYLPTGVSRSKEKEALIKEMKVKFKEEANRENSGALGK